MFAVTVYIDTDGDFYYTEPFLEPKDFEEKTFYFRSRKAACDALVKSFHNLYNSITKEDYKNSLAGLDAHIDTIVRKFANVNLEREIHNSKIQYKLVSADRMDGPDGSFYFKNGYVEFDTSWLSANMNESTWEHLLNVPDLDMP